MSKLPTFVRRLKKLGIEIDLVANIPWVYITRINGKTVTERFRAEHGFTVATYIHTTEFTDITEIFKLIRKYA